MADDDLMRELDEAEAAVAAYECEHHWTSRHRPGHIVYWVRSCSICREPDWDDLDHEIQLGVAELLGGPKRIAATQKRRGKGITAGQDSAASTQERNQG